MKKYIIILAAIIIACGSISAQSFTRVSIGPIVSDSSNTFDAAWGDYDNDGDLDLFITTRFESVVNPLSNNFLYENNCNGEFTKIIAIPGDITYGPSYQCNWIDYDNDDDLDLYIANAKGSDYLYQNNGDGTFTKVFDSPQLNDGKRSYTSCWADYDNDGYIDLFVGRPVGLNNELIHNNGDGTFTRITEGEILNDANHILSAAWADFDNDGDMDLYAPTGWVYDWQNFLYINNGDGTFTNDTDNVVVDDPLISYWSEDINWSCAIADYDNDLSMDIFFQSEYSPDH